jgi:hypothetical protein
VRGSRGRRRRRLDSEWLGVRAATAPAAAAAVKSPTTAS